MNRLAKLFSNYSGAISVPNFSKVGNALWGCLVTLFIHSVILGVVLVACTNSSRTVPTTVDETAIVEQRVSDILTLPPTPYTPTAILSPSITIMPNQVPTQQPLTITTPIPTAAPPLSPPLQGRIYFLWDSAERSDSPVQDLYLATFNNESDMWVFEPVLEGLIGWPSIALSPDQTQFALTKIDDKDGNGSASQTTEGMGFDGYNVYVYSLLDNSLRQVSYDFPTAYTLIWSPNSQVLTYQNYNNVVSSDSATLSNELVISLPTENDIARLEWSATGQILAIEQQSGELLLLPQNTQQLTLFESDLINQDASQIAWSNSDSWLATTIKAFKGLLLIDTTSGEVYPLVEDDFFSHPVWASTRTMLAFTQATREMTTVFVWNALTQEVQELGTSQGIIEPPLWSPVDDRVAIGVEGESGGQVVVFDMTTNESIVLWQGENAKEITPRSWSPDGEWLLFSAKRQGVTTFYLVHRLGGEARVFMETATMFEPYGFFWLPDLVE